MYRYGDGSPFPFDDNFIELVGAAVDACTAMFAAAAELDALRARARDARKEAEEDGKRLTAIERTLEQALFPSKPSNSKDATPAQHAAHKVLAGARTTLAAARVQLEKRAVAAAAEPRPDRALDAVRAAAGTLFDRYQLPRTIWDWKWRGDAPEGAIASATSRSARFTVDYDLELGGVWRGPVRIDALVPGAIARLPRRRVLGKPAPATVHLDRCALVFAEQSGDELVLRLREHRARPSPGWRVTVNGADVFACAVIDATGKALTAETAIDTTSATGLIRLVDAVRAAMDSARDHRRTREVKIGDTALGALVDATMTPRALLELLAPTIRNIRSKSRVPGELILKKDIADGRREELFVPRAAITARYASLPADYRRHFDDAGLGRGETDLNAALTDLSADAEVDTSPPTIPTRAMPPTAGPAAPTLMIPQVRRPAAPAA